MSTFSLDGPTGFELLDSPEGFSLDDDPTGTDELDGMGVEERAKAVLNEAQSAFRERARKENERMLLAVDSEFWVAFAFQTREQKEQFLKLANLIQLGDKYIDGWEAAKVLGIPIDRDDRQPYNTSDKLDQKWADLAL